MLVLFLLKKTVAALKGGLRLPPQAAGLVAAAVLLSLLAMGVSIYLALFAGRSLLPGPPRTAATQTPPAASVDVPSPQSSAARRSAPARRTLPAAGPLALAPSSQLFAPTADRRLEDATATAAVPQLTAVAETRPPVSGEQPVEAERASKAASASGQGRTLHHVSARSQADAAEGGSDGNGTGGPEDIRSRGLRTAAVPAGENAAHSSGGASPEDAFKADRD